jgi:hypothetical protein
MIAGMPSMNALSDLGYGMGDTLQQQQKDQTEEERRKKLLGMSSMGTNPLNFGQTGVASSDLGMLGASGR